VATAGLLVNMPLKVAPLRLALYLSGGRSFSPYTETLTPREVQEQFLNVFYVLFHCATSLQPTDNITTGANI